MPNDVPMSYQGGKGLKRAELPIFIWIKGGANFEPTTPVHKNAY